MHACIHANVFIDFPFTDGFIAHKSFTICSCSLAPCLLAEMIANVRHDMEFFIKYACGTLQNHSQTMPRFRVVGHALWAIRDNEEEWKLWNQWIVQAVTPANYTALEAVLP